VQHWGWCGTGNIARAGAGQSLSWTGARRATGFGTQAGWRYRSAQHSELHSEQCSDQHFPSGTGRFAGGALRRTPLGLVLGPAPGDALNSALGDMLILGCTREEVDDGTDFTGDGHR
jgi:hypothetical protein